MFIHLWKRPFKDLDPNELFSLAHDGSIWNGAPRQTRTTASIAPRPLVANSASFMATVGDGNQCGICFGSSQQRRKASDTNGHSQTSTSIMGIMGLLLGVLSLLKNLLRDKCLKHESYSQLLCPLQDLCLRLTCSPRSLMAFSRCLET